MTTQEQIAYVNTPTPCERATTLCAEMLTVMDQVIALRATFVALKDTMSAGEQEYLHQAVRNLRSRLLVMRVAVESMNGMVDALDGEIAHAG
jgi:hypothetical protein